MQSPVTVDGWWCTGKAYRMQQRTLTEVENARSKPWHRRSSSLSSAGAVPSSLSSFSTSSRFSLRRLSSWVAWLLWCMQVGRAPAPLASAQFPPLGCLPFVSMLVETCSRCAFHASIGHAIEKLIKWRSPAVWYSCAMVLWVDGTVSQRYSLYGFTVHQREKYFHSSSESKPILVVGRFNASTPLDGDSTA